MKKLSLEEQSIILHNYYGITEWREKCLVMTEEEKDYVLEHLEKENDLLMSIVKTPFPKFAENYCNRYAEKHHMLKTHNLAIIYIC